MWIDDHELMRLVRAVGYPFLFANGFVLLTVTFVPFPTAVLAEHLATEEPSAATEAVWLGCVRPLCLGRDPCIDDGSRTSWGTS